MRPFTLLFHPLRAGCGTPPSAFGAASPMRPVTMLSAFNLALSISPMMCLASGGPWTRRRIRPINVSTSTSLISELLMSVINYAPRLKSIPELKHAPTSNSRSKLPPLISFVFHRAVV
jgi:hypothetical protein